MDELTLLRRTRDDSREPSTETLTAGRTALLARIADAGATAATGHPKRKRRRVPPLTWAAALVAAAGLVTAGGLAAAGGAFTNPEAGPLPEGVTVVTQQVYEDAYAKFAACMREGGASIFGTEDEAGVYQFSFLDEAKPVYDRCYVDFAPVDFRWQISRSYYTPEFDSYRECLTNIGVEPGKDADTILAQLDESGLDARKCVEEGTPKG